MNDKDEHSVNVFAKSINQWCLGDSARAALLPNVVSIAGRTCHYSDNTVMQSDECNDIQIVILGPCVDVTGRWAKTEIAKQLCNLSFDEFLVAIETLCGVYVIFRVEDGRLKIFADAIHMMSVYYGCAGSRKGVVASMESLIIDSCESISKRAARVLDGAYGPGLYLAGDMSMYDEVKCLLANHYLDAESLCAVRYFPRENLKMAKTEEEISSIVDETCRMEVCAIKQFAQDMRFASPLTTGFDSRVNCVILRDVLPNADILYYAIETKDMRAEKRNVEFAKDVARQLGIEDFRVFQEVESLDDVKIQELRRECGPTRNWNKAVWTFHPEIGRRTIVSGQLIGHIMGSNLGKSMPKWLLSSMFIKAIQRNVSVESDQEMAKWYKEVCQCARGYSPLDLWLWEIRCGRWYSNLISINSVLGIRDINFYNSTKIISMWCRIPRRMREHKDIHRMMVGRFAPNISKIPVNPYKENFHSMHLPKFLDDLTPFWCRQYARYFAEKMRRR